MQMQKATDVLAGIYAEACKHGRLGLLPVEKQKLLYYCQAWSLAWTGRPLYEEEIQAWDNGPVTPAARGFLHVAEPVELPEETRAIIAAIYDKYGHLSSGELSEKTHQEDPWKQAYAAGRNSVISRDSMRRYYTAQSLQGKAPKKPALAAKPADLDEVLAIGERASAEWALTLELLGR